MCVCVCTPLIRVIVLYSVISSLSHLCFPFNSPPLPLTVPPSFPRYLLPFSHFPLFTVLQLPAHFDACLVHVLQFTKTLTCENNTCSPPQTMCSNSSLPCVPTGNLQQTINHMGSDDCCDLMTNLLMQNSRDGNDVLLFHSACHLLKQTSSIYTVNKLQSDSVDRTH